MNAMSLNRVERSFSRCFDSYHHSATQQAWIARHLVDRLSALGAPRRFGRAFEFGCGTGLLTEALQRQFEIPSLTLNDLTPSAARTAEIAGARFLPGDARNIDWPTGQDLVASSSTIQWVTDPQAMLRQAAGALAPNGWLAISGFGPGQYHELVAVCAAEQAPGLCGPAEFETAFARSSSAMRVLEASQTSHRLWFKTPKDVLRHLRRTGVNGTRSRVWTKTDLARFSETYWESFGTDQGVPLTYNPVWIIARKAD